MSSVLSHHRDQPGQHLLALLGWIVGHREHQGLFDLADRGPAKAGNLTDDFRVRARPEQMIEAAKLIH